MGKKFALGDIFSFIKLNDDEYDDDYYDEYDDDDDDLTPPSFLNRYKEYKDSKIGSSNTSPLVDNKPLKEKSPSSKSSAKLVPMKNHKLNASEVNVLKPDDFNDAQLIANNLCNGKTTVLNMEGIEIYEAQRIIDFISGCCYAIDGSLEAISSNIFIIAPAATEVSGDLIEEIFGDSYLSPELSKFKL